MLFHPLSLSVFIRVHLWLFFQVSHSFQIAAILPCIPHAARHHEASVDPSSPELYTRRGLIMLKMRNTFLGLAAALVLAGSVAAADASSGLTKGTPELKS